MLRTNSCRAALLLGALLLLPNFAAAAPSYQLTRMELESVMKDLKAWLPGEWNSFPQIELERSVKMPEEGEHEHWHRTFALIKAPQVGEVVFYGQINIGGRDGALVPGSQVLYRAWIDETRSAARRRLACAASRDSAIAAFVRPWKASSLPARAL